MNKVARLVAAAVGAAALFVGTASAETSITARTMAGYSLPSSLRLNLTNDDVDAQGVEQAVVKALAERGITVDDSSAVTLEISVDWDRPERKEGDNPADAAVADKFDRNGQGDLDDMGLMPYTDNTASVPLKKHRSLTPGSHLAIDLILYSANRSPLSSVSAVATRDARGPVEQAADLAADAVGALGTDASPPSDEDPTN